jgi:hypothetical protein
MGDTPSHAPYEEMQDTPWIKQGREIADKGGKGILENYNKVNVFDDATNRSLEARNNQIYKRAFDNMEREYTNTMNKYNAKNYNQFGTLNATPAAYRTDMYNLDAQRRLDDLAYNQAVNYDNLKDQEIQRRYNTLNMFGNMYQYGQTPYQQDVMNWNTRNTNKDIAYQNALVANQNGGGFGGALSGALQGGVNGFLMTGNPWGAVAGAGAGAIGGMM